MKNNIIQFTGVEERKKQITEMVLQGVPEDRERGLLGKCIYQDVAEIRLSECR